MEISYAVKNESIISANAKTNSMYSHWLGNHKDCEIIDVTTDDALFCSTDNLKYQDGQIVLDTEKIAEREKENQRQEYQAERDEALNTLTVIIDEMEFDSRPSDLSNFELGISTGQTEWVLR